MSVTIAFREKSRVSSDGFFKVLLSVSLIAINLVEELLITMILEFIFVTNI